MQRDGKCVPSQGFTKSVMELEHAVVVKVVIVIVADQDKVNVGKL